MGESRAATSGPLHGCPHHTLPNHTLPQRENDGWRVTVLADPGLPGGVVVRTRRGHTVTASVPGIEALGRMGRSLVLDGELVAGAGRASEFSLTAHYSDGGSARPG